MASTSGEAVYDVYDPIEKLENYIENTETPPKSVINDKAKYVILPERSNEISEILHNEEISPFIKDKSSKSEKKFMKVSKSSKGTDPDKLKVDDFIRKNFNSKSKYKYKPKSKTQQQHHHHKHHKHHKLYSHHNSALSSKLNSDSSYEPIFQSKTKTIPTSIELNKTIKIQDPPLKVQINNDLNNEHMDEILRTKVRVAKEKVSSTRLIPTNTSIPFNASPTMKSNSFKEHNALDIAEPDTKEINDISVLSTIDTPPYNNDIENNRRIANALVFNNDSNTIESNKKDTKFTGSIAGVLGIALVAVFVIAGLVILKKRTKTKSKKYNNINELENHQEDFINEDIINPPIEDELPLSEVKNARESYVVILESNNIENQVKETSFENNPWNELSSIVKPPEMHAIFTTGSIYSVAPISNTNYVPSIPRDIDIPNNKVFYNITNPFTGQPSDVVYDENGHPHYYDHCYLPNIKNNDQIYAVSVIPEEQSQSNLNNSNSTNDQTPKDSSSKSHLPYYRKDVPDISYSTRSGTSS